MSCTCECNLFSSQVIYERNNEVGYLPITLQIFADNDLYIKPHMWEKKKKNTTKPKIPTPSITLEQTQIQRKPILKSIKKVLHHSLPKNLIASQIISLGKSAWPELHDPLHPSAFPAASLGQTGERERKGVWKKLTLTSRNRSYAVLDVHAHINTCIYTHMYKYLFYPNSI